MLLFNSWVPHSMTVTLSKIISYRILKENTGQLLMTSLQSARQFSLPPNAHTLPIRSFGMFFRKVSTASVQNSGTTRFISADSASLTGLTRGGLYYCGQLIPADSPTICQCLFLGTGWKRLLTTLHSASVSCDPLHGRSPCLCKSHASFGRRHRYFINAAQPVSEPVKGPMD